MYRRWPTCMCLLACVMATSAVAQSNDSVPAPGEPLQEVTVTATRALDHKELAHAVSSFVQSHAAPGGRIQQIGRWYNKVCPLVTGLQPRANDFVTREVLDMARGVGAPAGATGKKCDTNVEIVFTRQPQALLDHIAKSYRIVLGYYPRSQVAQAMRFSRPIQAWYETATRSLNDHPGSVEGQISPQAQLDSDLTSIGWQPSGSADSLLSHGQLSEFAHILIIADSSELERYSLRSIADYVALLSLTRMAQLDKCAPLASITDLLAHDCAVPVADEITAADRAYLKGLYSANLDKVFNIEQGDVHERMMRQMEGK
jgi:hypothetical protein